MTDRTVRLPAAVMRRGGGTPPRRAEVGASQPRTVYRVALLNRRTNDAAAIDWWHQAPRRGGRTTFMSSVFLRLFRYSIPPVYFSVERRIAAVKRIGRWKWELEPLADGITLVAQHAELHRQAGSAPAAPFPFGSTPALLKLIAADTDRMMATVLAPAMALDKTGRWYVPKWRTAVRQAFGFQKKRQPGSDAGRGFPVRAVSSSKD